MIFSQESYESQEEMMHFCIKQIGMLVLGSLLADLIVRLVLFCEFSHGKSWRKCFTKTLLGYDRVGYYF